ncbi:MAG: iron-sulfur cluster assembly accessory protein [Bacteroidota bacterium]|nr:iron-sulfur cluster assembly accessory protein [Bacteroidota bacterium]
MVTITDSAKEKLLALLAKESDDMKFVRVGVNSGGCSGLTYELGFDKAQDNDDEVIQNNEITLLVNKKSLLYLAGTILEFSDGLNGKGFVFKNPNANRTCGCGESFSL